MHEWNIIQVNVILAFFNFYYEQKGIPIQKKYYQLWMLSALGSIADFMMTLRLWVS